MQKGTVVEKLVEETASDDKHLRQLINICEGKLLKMSRVNFLVLKLFLICNHHLTSLFLQHKDKLEKLL